MYHYHYGHAYLALTESSARPNPDLTLNAVGIINKEHSIKSYRVRLSYLKICPALHRMHGTVFAKYIYINRE